MTVVGTRPELIRLSRVLATLDAATDHVLVHTGQNYDYELNGVFFEDLGLRQPDHFLEAAGGTAAETIGQVIARSDAVMRERKPGALLILGDTNSALCAIAAKRQRIPVFHMEAGNRAFDMRVPEEINRRIIDHISDVNLPYSQIAREYLLREGLPPDRVIRTGSPMLEVLTHYRPRIDASNVLQKLGLRPREFFVVSAHREENIDEPRQFGRLLEVLDRVATSFGQPVIVSTHPRTRKQLEASGRTVSELVQFLRPLAFTDYVRLQMEARAVLSDSGTITEESSILNFPAVNIREAHERPEGMEEGAVVMTGLDANHVVNTLRIVESQRRGAARDFALVRDYDVPNVSQKVLRIILSYTSYVRRTVWHEYDT